MPAFVIHEHRCHDQVHWDLMLEEGNILATWQVPIAPDRWGPDALQCEKIFDHRHKYLTYQGPISQNRGEVSIVTRGDYRPLSGPADTLTVNLTSPTLTGKLTLQHVQEQTYQLTYFPETNS